MSEQQLKVDVAVIGAGTAGLVAHRQARVNGAERVVLIEGGPYGTTCARVGCMPSKLLIAAAEAAEAVRSAEQFGVKPGPLEIDGAAVMARVQRERDRFVEFVVESTQRLDPAQRLRGWARFVGPTTLEVQADDRQPVRVDAKAVVIAAGTTPWVPPSLRGLGDRLLTSDSVFDLPRLPKSLAVVGAGVIGLELGQAMHRLGVETSILSIDERMPLVSSAVMQDQARELFTARLDLQLGISELQAQRRDDSVVVSWNDASGRAREGTFEYVLAATGRRASYDRLELQHAGIELDDRGAPKFWDERTTQVGDAPIFLAGDVIGDRQVLHEAAGEGRIAGINAARYPEVRAHPRQVPIAIMFSDPNVAIVGEIPDPDSEGCEWEVGEVDYADQGRARVIGQNHGRVRIYARRCGELIGAELIGPQAEHMAHLLAWSIEQGMTVTQARAMPYYHPTVEEGLRTAIQALGRKLKMVSKQGPLDCGPGT
ncbi:dihydrolipoyl dehydrogenase [Enhygromyxa salina]|uniref:Dihydrolipoyl dehydrogenase n=1 Tax=Enhygromyxa salina TaxID=215803 RepID=A0A2S9YTT6_9BACT|nr:dihydrolipoyl dehydrogenase [Enhygromyxa salina]PRQ08490.1 Dihydrolipoyl dehydrogenase [Enhygromyxa salina]